MKTVFLLFDSLNLRVLENYGSKIFETPNFKRLGKKTIKFNNHFVGSMPCMPARRDLQSGRLSFLHRGWGPLEPFDNSFPEIMKKNKVYSHLISDHYHYFEDGGSTYHTRYNSFEFIRGQERDPWKPMLDPPIKRFREIYHNLEMQKIESTDPKYAYPSNREFILEEKDFPSVKCFNSGLDFLNKYKDSENWFLQIETFDPHEPFFAPERFINKFNKNLRGPIIDWPHYGKSSKDSEISDELRSNYFALVSLCDFLLGSILDFFDKFDLWNDTALVLTTDHGFMLGEHDWWGKGVMPLFNEIAHIPLFFYHPDLKQLQGTESDILTQNIDLMPTFLEMHNLEIPREVQGKSILKSLSSSSEKNYSIYGYWGSGINITDGNHTFFWYPENDEKKELNQYTLMPMNMRSFFSAEELKGSKFSHEFKFTKGMPVLKVPYTKQYNKNIMSNINNKSLLFNIVDDPAQLNPIINEKKILEMKSEIIHKIESLEAPKEMLDRFQFQ